MKTPPVMRTRSTALLLITQLLIQTAGLALAASRNRLIFPRKVRNFAAGDGVSMETTIRPSAGVKDTVRERPLIWRDLEHKEPLLNNSHTHLSQTLVPGRQKRGRRHALLGSRGHVHGQLMRVGCVLGTCQVHNLGYRLYQLIGQRKKEHSSPINPKSPHSYG